MGVINICILVFIVSVVSAQYGGNQYGVLPQFIKSKYGSNSGPPQPASYSGVKTFTKTKTRVKTAPAQSSYAAGHLAAVSKFKGGCNTKPPTPMNAGIRCSQYSGCRANCVPDYQFPNGATELFITCIEGKWEVEGAEWEVVPSCEPICLPPCLNNGICIGPNQCNCPENFSGPQCQFENKQCLNLPPLPINSRRSCRSKTCTITCMPGHQFFDGSTITTMICKNGFWVPAKEKWTSIPDCQATCNPPCQNGGNCLSFNVCQCPQIYRGPQCQYRADACSAKKLQFNGGYNCSGDSETFSCSLTCPEGIQFEFKPDPVYMCSYQTGTFVPSQIPQCIFPENVEVIPMSGSAQSFYHIMNNSKFNLDGMSVNGLPEITQMPDGGFPFQENFFKYPVTANPDKNTDDTNFEFVPVKQFRNLEDQLITVEEKLPEPGICFTWGGSHYKTFDGKVFSFNSKCAHTLVRDGSDNTFSVVVQNAKECYNASPNCHKIIKVYFQSKEYVLKRTDAGEAILTSNKKILPIPGQLPGLRMKMEAHYIVLLLDTIGAKIKWDGEQLVQVEVKESAWNRTEGLCGKIDGHYTNDMLTKDGHKAKTVAALATSWRVQDLEADCDEIPTEELPCQDNGIKGSKSHSALIFCKKLINDERFTPCHKVMDISVLLDACRWDYCSCTKANPSLCACETMNVYVRSCFYKGVKNLALWRDDKTCPMECSEGRVYKSCDHQKGQEVCGGSAELPDDEDSCVEGCYCPPGTVLHDNHCITRDNCPCRLRGKIFLPGTQIPKDCNTCTCNHGQWVCTQVACGARCSAIGDPHYISFDSKRFDFMGQCSYYMVKTDSFSIETENVACAGSISQAMNLPSSVTSGLPSCTKAVTIKISGHTIKLKQNHDLVVNGQDISEVPYHIANITIRIVSSIFLQVELPNGIQVWWDGVTRVYIDVPAGFKEKTKGLCGTFNYNQKDDFLTPEGDIEQATIPFANKWKTSEKCNDIPNKLKSHPCNINIHNKPTAEHHCAQIKSKLFEKCHWTVDPEPYYQDCLYDMCSCEFKTSKCLCPTIAAYAEECSRKGIKIEWRHSVRECGIHCPGGQAYQVCGNSCTRTCFDVATRTDCKPQCVEGCNCPEGEALDDDGDCVPIGRCKCQQDGLEFHAGYKEVRPASKGPELCTCINAEWSCRLATPEELKLFPESSDLKSLCSGSEHMEFTTCEPVEPITCKNMHSPDYFSASVCHPGCTCKKDYVLDSSTKKCVKPTECPCHHGGKSYHENETVQNDCNTCQCQNGKWKCSDRPCAAECSAWGDSHYKTFDGKHFDYQGQCNYALAKGSWGSDSFDIAIQSVSCGSLGTSCSKSVTIRVNAGNDKEVLTLSKDKPLPNYASMKHIAVREKGLFVIVEALDLGIVVRWDQGTRVYVNLDPRWKDKVKGLCGNYNDNDDDDFQTPFGGVTEISAKLFGDSWKLQAYCPEALEITNTCEERPDRKVWALKKCGILKSSLFAPCHSEVPIDDYLEKCIFDTCACDQGGDCECLCTALAAYAQECNNRGIPIKWRSQKLCPMQCDERCSNYSPCVSTCPTETCDNLLIQSKLTKSCQEENCVEGCVPKPCPIDHIYLNSSFLECVPRNICKPVCLEIENVTYYEGDLVEEDDCHSCFCSRGQKICKGQPCVTMLPVTTPLPTTHQLEQLIQCKSGWTTWLNQDKTPPSKTKTRGKMSDIEPIPNDLVMNNLKDAKCSRDKMTDIECRTVKGHWSPKQTGLDVECSLEKGLVCKSKQKGKPCKDFEIRVFCECEPPTVSSTGCDPDYPHQEHPTDCHLFYHCQLGLNGSELIEKTCGPSMFYNPVSRVCDWPYAVAEIKPECKGSTAVPLMTSSETYENLVEPEVSQCPPGQVRDDCALQCDRMCVFYSHIVKQSGNCNNDRKCDSGCVSAEKKMSCPSGMMWANDHTCVAVYDCLCRSNDGKPVKPGTVYRESDCTVCQCIDNHYTCDNSSCMTTSEVHAKKRKKGKLSQLGEELALPSFGLTTVSPPKECDRDDFIDLLQGDQPLADDAFNASSILSPSFKPQFSKFGSTVSENSGGSWAPEYSNNEQYLQIDLGRQEPIYGIKIKGSPLYNEYVTSFKILYSPDGGNFIPVLNKERLPQIFRGSVDATTPVEQLFDTPFEAEIIRINPQTWHNGISLRIELIGCGEPKTTPEYEFVSIVHSYSTTSRPKFCEDPMGLGDGTLYDSQLSVSSEIDNSHSKIYLNISGDGAWQPITNSPTEFVEFDFLEPRNITGLVTKGGPAGWVTTFTVQYSDDRKNWNTILDKTSLDEKVFLGNYDNDSPQINSFDLPISTRYVKVIPKKWNDNIQLRVEMHGCFKPYPAIESIITTVGPSPCNDCPGVETEPLEMQACRCKQFSWWDGENCVNRTDCPCMVGHISYAVGTVYENEDCSQCLCKLGGVSHCSPKQCDSCEKGLRSTVTSTCKCTCQPCPEGTTLCPTSNICINSTLWCNGIQNCPDDEISCITTVAPTEASTVVTERTVKKCPKLECPQGYKQQLKKTSKVKKYHSYLSPMFSNYGRKAVKSFYQGALSGVKTGVKGGAKRPGLQRPQNLTKPVEEREICPEFACISQKPPPKFIHGRKECPPVACPLNYIPLFDIEEESGSNECPRYTCNSPPLPDAVCNVTGRTFNTFDETEYKYDICNHILARDVEDDEWDISLKKNCSQTCWRNLIIRHQDHLFVLHPDLNVEFDGYKYTVDQTKKIGTQTQAFSISLLGNTLLFVSNRFGFWVIWDKEGNVKLGAVRKLVDKIDGLCGYFNENPVDDKRKPDGTEARTTVEFGDSWAQADQPALCETKACPMHVQNKAWAMCNKVKDQILAPCARVVDIEAFVSRCMETACECLQSSEKNHTAEEQCRCKTLESFVVDCLTADPNTDVTDWRMQLDCPITCEAPLIYHDCYQRRCEPTCESISDPNVCPKLLHVCFPGCYCPPGFVKKADVCVKPSSCRDCECNVLPHLQYVTYDDSNFTINGNCVYVMSRDASLNDIHKFQVLITNAPCEHDEKKTCVGKVTILYENHKIHILNDRLRNKLRMIVDGDRIDNFAKIQWADVKETVTKHIKLLLTDIQVAISVYYPSLGTSVKVSSHKYAAKLEGLCGDCNKEPSDDIRTAGGAIIENIDDFALSWLYDKLPGGQSKEMCENKPKEECPLLPPDSNPCMQLLDFNKFGQCLRILDPGLFVEWCNKDICGNHPELACTAIEAYARDCATAGFCINWRNDICPAKTCSEDKIYNPCGSSCLKTCESIKMKEEPCKSIPVEGCDCPEGKVLLNDTCVVEEDCIVCDDEGHHPGDEWKKDKCTSCRCDDTTLKCKTTHCPEVDRICEKGYHAVKVSSKEEECCDKYACLPEPTSGPTCETPQSLVCGSGQIMKLDTKPNGCQQFICECKPVENCDTIDLMTEAPLQDGYIREIDESGCCPEVKVVCKPELCPKPPPCEQYYSLQNYTLSGIMCCPMYVCEPPKDKCIYENEYTASDEGGERPRSNFEKQKTLRPINDSWKDGPCRECKCLNSTLGLHSTCTKIECPSIETSQDFLDYKLEPEYVFDQCCPNSKRVACKYQDKIYNVGDKWRKEDENCTFLECLNTTTGVEKTIQITHCNENCDLGSKYVPADSESKECCGTCKPYACVVDGKIQEVGNKWYSDDYCTNYFCLNINGSMQVQSLLVNCPELPSDYMENFVFDTVLVPKECCKKHKATACKVDGKVYRVGETWSSPDGNKCKNVTCIAKNTDDLVKQETVETCKTDCPKGWEYKKSNNSCCGQCIQVACIVDETLKQPGENWTSPDNCTLYNCEIMGDQFSVSSQQESCPSLEDCAEENIYIKGCCKHCNITSAPQTMCSPEAIAVNKTLGIIKAVRPPHGECMNKEIINDFTECVGSCHSSTYFNLKSGSHESECFCCQATKYKSLEIELVCQDGYIWKKKVAVPSACGCEGCAAQKKYAKMPTKTFVKS